MLSPCGDRNRKRSCEQCRKSATCLHKEHDGNTSDARTCPGWKAMHGHIIKAN